MFPTDLTITGVRSTGSAASEKSSGTDNCLNTGNKKKIRIR